MTLKKSQSVQQYTIYQDGLLSCLETLKQWSRYCKQCHTWLSIKDLSPEQQNKLESYVKKVISVNKEPPSVASCLRRYRANKKWARLLEKITLGLQAKKRGCWQQVVKRARILTPAKKIWGAYARWITYHTLNNIVTLCPPSKSILGPIIRKIQIRWDIEHCIVELLSGKIVKPRQGTWQLSQSRCETIARIMLQDIKALVGKVSSAQSITFKKDSPDSKNHRLFNTTTFYVRLNQQQQCEISINSTTGSRASKLCGTHKDGSIHWVCTLNFDNRLHGSKRYGVYYHHKSKAQHSDFIQPVFKSDDGYLHLEYGGEDLVESLNKRNIKPKQQQEIMLQCILILQKLHRSKRHHMDIKIDNVLVNLEAEPVKVSIIDIPNRLSAGQKTGYMVTSWHSIMPKQIHLPKKSPLERSVLQQTGAQIFHDYYALVHLYMIMLKCHLDERYSNEQLRYLEKHQKQMITNYYTSLSEHGLTQAIARMNQTYSMENLLDLFVQLNDIDINHYHHKHLQIHIENQSKHIQNIAQAIEDYSCTGKERKSF